MLLRINYSFISRKLFTDDTFIHLSLYISFSLTKNILRQESNESSIDGGESRIRVALYPDFFVVVTSHPLNQNRE